MVKERASPTLQTRMGLHMQVWAGLWERGTACVIREKHCNAGKGGGTWEGGGRDQQGGHCRVKEGEPRAPRGTLKHGDFEGKGIHQRGF